MLHVSTFSFPELESLHGLSVKPRHLIQETPNTLFRQEREWAMRDRKNTIKHSNSDSHSYYLTQMSGPKFLQLITADCVIFGKKMLHVAIHDFMRWGVPCFFGKTLLHAESWRGMDALTVFGQPTIFLGG